MAMAMPDATKSVAPTQIERYGIRSIPRDRLPKEAPLTTAPRISPAQPPYPERIQAQLTKIMPDGVPPLILFQVLARDERLFSRFMAGGLLDRGHLSLRQRELAILRTCARCGSEYEWGVHAAFFADRVGLSAEQVAGTTAAVIPAGLFDESERQLLTLMDALHDRATVDDSAWADLRLHFAELQLLELTMLAGLYHMVSFITNATALPLEPFATRFPPSAV